MAEKPTVEQVVAALKCVSSTSGELHQVKDCPYLREDTDHDNPFCCDADRACKDAANLIRSQAARIRELKTTVPRWIPVSDKENRPEDGQRVWVCYSDDGYIEVLEYAANENDGDGAFGRWTSERHIESGLVDEWFDVYLGVAHWMPMPEPPKEVKHGK